MYDRAFLAGVLALTLSISAAPASAGWGCLVVDPGGGRGRVWNEPTRASAEANVLKLCRDAGTKGCRVSACRNNVDTEAQAEAIWGGLPGKIDTCSGKGCR